MIQTLTYRVNVAPEGVPPVVRLSQNENGRQLVFDLGGSGVVDIPAGAVVTISGTKPDGVVYSATGTMDGTNAVFNEDTQMTAVAGEWDAKIRVTYNGATIATVKIWFAIDSDPVEAGAVPSDSELEGLVAEAQQYAESARSAAYGSPLTAATAAAMTDTSKVYVYTGSETGYTAGHWYYYNGTAWTDGGVYQSAGVQTDTTLTVAGMPADAKATGDEITDLKDALDDETEARELLETRTATIERVIGIGDLTLGQIHKIVQSGEAPNYFGYGDQINLNYKNGSTDYVLPWDVVAFGDFELQDGEIRPGMVIQSHYAMQAVQYSASQAAYVCKTALPAGTYHFSIGTSWGSHCVSGKVYQFTTTQEIPAGGQIVIGSNTSFYTWGAQDVAPANWRVYTFASASSVTPLDDKLTLTEGGGGTDLGTLSSTTKFGAAGMTNLQSAAYGYNRWSHSANRQFYNSGAAANNWWTPQHPEDRPPQQLATLPGFMAGFDEAFLNIIKPVKVTTVLNTVSDSNIGTSEDTFDTFFLPSLEQEYIVPQLAGVEGDYWPYWKERLGLTSPQAQGTAGTNSRHIRYAFDAKTSAQYCRLRSAYRYDACSVWYVNPAGSALGSYATLALRGCPACVII